MYIFGIHYVKPLKMGFPPLFLIYLIDVVLRNISLM